MALPLRQREAPISPFPYKILQHAKIRRIFSFSCLEETDLHKFLGVETKLAHIKHSTNVCQRSCWQLEACKTRSPILSRIGQIL